MNAAATLDSKQANGLNKLPAKLLFIISTTSQKLPLKRQKHMNKSRLEQATYDVDTEENKSHRNCLNWMLRQRRFSSDIVSASISAMA